MKRYELIGNKMVEIGNYLSDKNKYNALLFTSDSLFEIKKAAKIVEVDGWTELRLIDTKALEIPDFIGTLNI